MRQGRPPARGVFGILALAVAGLAGCPGKGRPPASAPAPAAASTAAAIPVCGPPKQILVSERADDGDSSRLQILSPHGEVLWEGPAGSGESPGVWSPDGRLLAYAVGADLIVHRDRGPDKLVFRGLDVADGDSLFSFSRDGRWLAAVGATSVRVVDAAESRNLEPVSIDTKITCTPNGLYWTRTSNRLVVTCDGGEMHLWDPATKTDRSRVIEAASIVSWWPVAADTLLVQRDDDSYWLQPLEGEPRKLPLVLDAGDLTIDSIVPRSGAVVLSDYDESEGYPRTLWLADSAGAPPQPWLDGSVMGLGYSADGAWAVFTTAPADETQEPGDVYLSRVGQPRVWRVVAAPTYNDADDDGEGVDAPSDQPYYLGYTDPSPRPDPMSVCHPVAVKPHEQLEVERRYRSKEDQAFVTGGGVIHIVADGHVELLAGAHTLDVGDATLIAVQDAALLPDGSWLVSDPSTTYWRAADGHELAHMPRITVSEAVLLPGGVLAYAAGADRVELRSADGKVLATHITSGLLDSVAPAPVGVAAFLASGNMELLDASGHQVGTIEGGGDVSRTSLGGWLLTVAPDEGDDERPPLVMTFYDPTGRVSAIKKLTIPDEDLSVNDLFAIGEVAVIVVGENRPRAHFVDRNGHEVGEFFLGMAPDGDIVTLDDHVAVIPVAGRYLYVVDSRGHYLAGYTLAGPILKGPVALDRQRIAVDTGDEVLVLRRNSR